MADSEFRILQYVRVLDNGGIESLIFNLLDKTDRSIVNFDFLLTRNQEEAHEKYLVKYGAKKIIVETRTGGFLPFRILMNYKRLRAFFRTCNYPIVHFQAAGESLTGAFAILAAKNAGIPIRIVHAHAAGALKESWLRRLNFHLGKWAHLRWGTHFMACSRKAAEFCFGKNYERYCKVEILKNGIDTPRFRFDPDVRSTIRRKLNLDNRFVIGSIARLSPQKNHPFMFEVLREVIRIQPDAILLLVGSASAGNEGYAQKVLDAIKDPVIVDHVRFLGERHDAHRLYNAMDAFLLPSLWEGLPIAAIEAQTNGLPVFAASTVTDEVKLTPTFHFLDLTQSPLEWASAICSHENTRFNARKASRLIEAAGYDISSSARFLTQYYRNFQKLFKTNQKTK